MSNDPDLELEDADEVDLQALAPAISDLFAARGLRVPELARLIAKPAAVDETPSAPIVPYGRTLAEVPYVKPPRPRGIPGRF